jgi:hypothetical protein
MALAGLAAQGSLDNPERALGVAVARDPDDRAPRPLRRLGRPALGVVLARASAGCLVRPGLAGLIRDRPAFRRRRCVRRGS